MRRDVVVLRPGAAQTRSIKSTDLAGDDCQRSCIGETGRGRGDILGGGVAPGVVNKGVAPGVGAGVALRETTVRGVGNPLVGTGEGDCDIPGMPKPES